jgi:hypothetical protein
MTSVEFSEQTRQRTLGEEPLVADYPVAPVFPPHAGCSCGVSSHRGQGDSRHPEPDTLPWPDTYGITWDDQIGIEIRNAIQIPVPTPETSGDGDIVVRRVKYRCYRCYPSYLASRWRRFPWTFTVSLSAPVGCFEDWWDQADVSGRLDRLVPRAHSVVEMLAEPFWVGVFATQPRHAWKRVGRDRNLAFDPRGGEPHAHLVVGNVSREQLDTVLAQWPGVTIHPRYQVIKPITHAWGALHYALSQTRIDRQKVGESYARYINRVKSDHARGQDALLNAPFESDTLDVQDAIMRIRRSFKKTRPRMPEATAWGKRMASKRWAKRRTS